MFYTDKSSRRKIGPAVMMKKETCLTTQDTLQRTPQKEKRPPKIGGLFAFPQFPELIDQES
jgi:hypothetical protein